MYVRNEISSHGVVLGEQLEDKRWRVITLMSSGEIWDPMKEDIMFSVPAVATSDLVSRCGLGLVATKKTELNARVAVLKLIREVETTIEEATKRLHRTGDTIFSVVAASDPHKWETTTVEDVARLISSKPDLITVFATHKYLMNRPNYYVAQQAYHTTHKISVRPKADVEELDTILSWSRTKDGPIDSFAAKAREVIELNKRNYTDSHAEPPTRLPALHTWSKDDSIIIAFLLHSLRPHRTTQGDPYSIGQSAILRRLDPKGPTIDDHRVHEVLVNLGAIAPWQDVAVMQPELQLDLTREAITERQRAEKTLVDKALSSRKTVGRPIGPEDFYPSDPLESIRHDWGDLPVYVVDDATAKELDDGVSIERIPSELNSFWVHVHIADPASLIPPTHVLAKEAERKGESMYFLQRTWPLLPPRLTHSPEEGPSLGSRSTNGQADRVLTFSAKVDAGGEIQDTQVRAGLVRNVQRLSYSAVDFGMTRSVIPVSYPFGGRPPLADFTPLTDVQYHDLLDLQRIADGQAARRLALGILLQSEKSAQIVHSEMPESLLNIPSEPSHFRGFPALDYIVSDQRSMDSGARNIIAEMMKLAGRVASRFCKDRNIPVMRRVLSAPIFAVESERQALLEMRNSCCYIPIEKAVKSLQYQAPSYYSLEPKGHWGLGILDGEGYVRATSPLRRYSDLVVHWQLHHGLLGSNSPTRSPPFDVARMEKMLSTTAVHERDLKRNQKMHESFWRNLFLKRWMESRSTDGGRVDDPLTRLEGLIMADTRINTQSKQYHVEVYIPLLGCRALLVSDDRDQLATGNMVPIEIKEIRLGVRPKIQVGLKS